MYQALGNIKIVRQKIKERLENEGYEEGETG